MKAAHFYPLLWSGFLLADGSAWAEGPYPPAAGVPGSTAISRDDALILGWATGYDRGTFQRGFLSVAERDLGEVTFGNPEDALGPADVKVATLETFPVVSLGDGGAITMTFAEPITNGPGFDFAVFENGFTDTFLELAFVEVSSDGDFFSRFPAVSLTPTAHLAGDPTTDDFTLLDPTNLHNLAGKYRGEQGTPFDLMDIVPNPRVNTKRITHVRVVDVVGSINPAFGSYDSGGRIIKDPYPTRFESGGFDLDAVAVINQIPEPGACLSLTLAAALLGARRRRR